MSLLRIGNITTLLSRTIRHINKPSQKESEIIEETRMKLDTDNLITLGLGITVIIVILGVIYTISQLHYGVYICNTGLTTYIVSETHTQTIKPINQIITTTGYRCP